ncbi:MAG: hypothetical protein R6X20_09250 [Phycisphaerae bacterium]
MHTTLQRLAPPLSRLILAAMAATALMCVPGRAPAAAGDATYMNVPVRGDLAPAVHADGLASALKWAAQNPRIGHVVLHIQSGAGSVEAAKAMVSLIRGYRKRFTFHALVDRALGPAAAVALACDTLHVAPKATLGGLGLEGEGAEALGREAAAVALETKRPVLLVQSVFDAPARLCAWVDADGNVHVDTKKPDEVASGDLLVQHAGKGPLLLSANQAVELRLADGKADSVEALGHGLTLKGWHSVGDYALGVMRRLRMNVARREREAREKQERIDKNHQRRVAVLRILEDSRQEAVRNDPRRYDYAVEEDLWDGETRMTPAARLQWRRNTEAAIQAWFRVQRAIRELVELEKEARSLGGEPLVDEVGLRLLMDRSVREIQRLKREKHTTSPIAGPFGASSGVRDRNVNEN